MTQGHHWCMYRPCYYHDIYPFMNSVVNLYEPTHNQRTSTLTIICINLCIFPLYPLPSAGGY